MSAAAELEQVNDHITIDVGRSIAGATFRLYVGSKKHLQRLNPGARMWPRVFIDRGTPTDFEPIEPSLGRHVVELLTGMTPEQIYAHGLEIDFYDCVEEMVIQTMTPGGDPATPAASAAGIR